MALLGEEVWRLYVSDDMLDRKLYAFKSCPFLASTGTWGVASLRNSIFVAASSTIIPSPCPGNKASGKVKDKQVLPDPKGVEASSPSRPGFCFFSSSAEGNSFRV